MFRIIHTTIIQSVCPPSTIMHLSLCWAEGEVLWNRVPAGHSRLQRAGWTDDPLHELWPQEETLLQGHRQGHRHAWGKEYVPGNYVHWTLNSMLNIRLKWVECSLWSKTCVFKVKHFNCDCFCLLGVSLNVLEIIIIVCTLQNRHKGRCSFLNFWQLLTVGIRYKYFACLLSHPAAD